MLFPGGVLILLDKHGDLCIEFLNLFFDQCRPNLDLALQDPSPYDLHTVA